MKYPCDTVKDLLPLYYDGVCSEASKKIVEEHLAECDSCAKMMKSMGDNTYEKQLQEEREHVVEHHAKTVKRKSLTVGMGLAGFLMIPILVCLIVNLATGHALDWFFVVLTGLLVFASVTVVPLMLEEKRGLWTLVSFTASLTLLLLTCNIFVRGNWFLVTWISVLFGLAVVFFPFVLRQLPLGTPLSHHKGMLAMAVDTIFLYAVIIVCGIYAGGPGYWQPALLITTVCALFAWALFGVIRYVRKNKCIRAGISVMMIGIFGAMMHDIVNGILEGSWYFSISDMNLRYWNSDQLINANSYFLILLTGCVVGIILLLIGIVTQKHRKR